ncbi:MAG: hypothetical protein ACXW53_07200 [Candidatus Binatia bacterium]
MTNLEKLSLHAVSKLPPMLFGVIRWKKNLGSPAGDPCSGFRIVVEERTPSEFRAGPGGVIEVIPGTGQWRLVTDSAPCTPVPDEGDSHVIRFYVPNVDLNGFPYGQYRIAPQLSGDWDRSELRWFLGSRQILPISQHVVLTKEAHIQTVEFEVVRRSRFWNF